MSWLLSPNFLWVFFGTLLLGVAAGALGSFAFLRGRSLMGDALAHAALPGVCAAFIAAEALRARGVGADSKSLPLLLLGASVTGMIAAASVSIVTRYSRLKEDVAQAIALSVFFGMGVVLLSWIQRSGAASQSGLDKFLFGQTSSLVGFDVWVIGGVAVVLCALCVVFFKELKLLCFDAGFGEGLGFSMARLDTLLLVMIVGAVVIGLQAVGVVLISALLITPPAAARFWTDRLDVMVILSALLGGISGVLGSILSAVPFLSGLPTGPSIVLAATFVFVISVVFAPRRGVLSRARAAWRTRARIKRENALRALYEAQEKRGDARSPVPVSQIPRMSGAVLGELKSAGLVAQSGAGENAGVTLTPGGLEVAHELVRRHRLWQMFLMYESAFDSPHAAREADNVEHFLPPESVAQLETRLREVGLEPSLQPATPA